MGELMDYTEPVDLSAYIPLAGGTWTGAMTLSGSFSGANSAVWLGKDANGPIFNVGAGGGGGSLQVMSGGALNINLNETYGLIFYTNQTVASASAAAQICRTSGHFNINAQNGADVQIQSGGSNLAIFSSSQAYLGATTFAGTITFNTDAAAVNGVKIGQTSGRLALQTGGGGPIALYQSGTLSGEWGGIGAGNGFKIYNTSGAAPVSLTNVSGVLYLDLSSGADELRIRDSSANLLLHATTSALSISKDIAHTASGSLNGIYKNADTSVFAITGGSGWAYTNGAWDARYGNSHATKPGIYEIHSGSNASAAIKLYDQANAVCAEFGIPGSNTIKSGGKSHAGDGTWRDHFDLVAGIHYGFVWVTDDAGSASLYVINSTTITFYANFGANLWGSADATHRHLRVSGGKIQVYCGSTYGTAYVTLTVVPTVR